MEAFDLLSPEMRRWVWRQGWKSLNALQQSAVGPVLARQTDVILSAPTAAGKTEAAFLPILTDLSQHGAPREGFGALVISPLKALINDQRRRLDDMAEGSGVAVHAWHGDVAQNEKERALRSPSGGVLMITPESLEAMLTLRPRRARELFGALRYIVIDELHAFIGTERGVQLQSLLNRLGCPAVPRVALSATIADRDEAARFLRPDGSRHVVAPSADFSAQPPARIAIKEYVATDRLMPEDAIADDLFKRLRGRNNLVFTNSRKDAEAYTVALKRIAAEERLPDEFRIHHGSLSRPDRHAVEQELQEGVRPVTAVCTASMELGVDIGSVASVAQIGAAQSAAAMRQRLGRSGRRGESAVMRVYSVDEMRDDYKFHLRANLVQNIAVTELLREGRFEAAPPPDAFLSIAVQQLLGLLGQYGSLRPDKAYGELCRRGPFVTLAPPDFALLLRHLGQKGIVAQTASGLLVVGDAGERLASKRDFFSAFTAAPDYEIVDSLTHKTVGSVQYKPYYGEVFILGGEMWIVDSVEEHSKRVYAGHTVAKGKMMFEGTGPELSADVVQKMRSVLACETQYPYLDASTGTPQQLEEARRWFMRHSLDSQPWYSHADRPTYFTWGGKRANRTLALMAEAELGLSLQYDHLAVQGLTPDSLGRLRTRLPAAEEMPAYLASLAARVNRAKKERGKFDPFLPDALLDRQYAAQRLAAPLL